MEIKKINNLKPYVYGKVINAHAMMDGSIEIEKAVAFAAKQGFVYLGTTSAYSIGKDSYSDVCDYHFFRKKSFFSF